jgi:gliding motility-associated-like protein
LDLGAGSYAVTVTDLSGCTAIVNVVIKDNCGGLAAFKQSLEVMQVPCDKGNTSYCVDLDFIDFVTNYTVTDNGAPYKGKFEPCSILNTYEYILEGVEGVDGLTLEYWKVGKQTYSGTFEDMKDLLSKMNTWDPTGKWNYDAITQSIYAEGNNSGKYGEMRIKDTAIDQSWLININQYATPQGLKLNVSMGNHSFVMKHKTLAYQDTMQFVIACTQPNVIDINMEVGEQQYFDLSTTELVGTKCAISATYVEATNPVADITFTKKGDAIRGVEGMQIGIETVKYSMCDEYGICDTSTVRIIVRARKAADVTPEAVDTEIKVFNGFSPNGDGINDAFLIKGIEYYPKSTLSIYNRWGNMVYKIDAYKNDWKGTWNNTELPDGTYFYNLNDGKGNSFNGYLQLER